MGFGVRIESAVSTEATPWPKRFWKCLQHSRKHQSISRGHLRGSSKRQKVFRGTCGAPANTKAFPVGLAGLQQTPKSFPRHLRGSRKRQSISRGACGAPANAKKFSEALAGLPQTPKSFSRDLRDSRKHQKVSRETCNGVASISKSTMTAAARYQRPSLWISPPISSSNLRYGKEDHARGWDLHRSAKSLKAGAALIRLPWRPLGL